MDGQKWGQSILEAFLSVVYYIITGGLPYDR